MSASDALVYVREVIDALTMEGWRASAADVMLNDPEHAKWERIPTIESSISADLQRVNCQLGPRGNRPFDALIESIDRALIAAVAAEKALSMPRNGEGGR